METLESMKQTLIAAAQGQMGNLEQVNAKELGEVIDMIKDLEEAAYYCAITKTMKESEEKEKSGEDLSTAMQLASMMTSNRQSMNEPSYYTPYMYDMNRIYYDGRDQRRGYDSSTGMNQSSGRGSMGSSYNNSSSRGYYEYPYMPPMETVRDYREGRSPISRRGYMEAKENHQDKEVQMKELEKYLSELSQDITEMISDASPEAKMVLQQRLNTLATKIKA